MPRNLKKIEIPECSYILGLLWADGYIRENLKTHSKYVILESGSWTFGPTYLTVKDGEIELIPIMLS